MDFYPLIEEILKQPYLLPDGNEIGKSIEERSIQGFVLGHGPKKTSLIAGNHADEPIGPLLLKKLVNFLRNLDENHEILKQHSFYIVPHANPDGEARNLKWYSYEDKETNLAEYLRHVIRELPGEDMEFGYPIKNEIEALRPENLAIYEFWEKAESPFHLHVSLHGMGKSTGAWYLIDSAWKNRTDALQQKCVIRTKDLGYSLHDLNRNGEKGFYRIAEGFCTRPDSQEMRMHFMSLGDFDVANKFHPSSMESIRSLGGDCLTLVSEMPLFLFPNQERELKWPDQFLINWNNQFALWKSLLITEQMSDVNVVHAAHSFGLRAMSWEDQMRLQWQFIVAGMETV